MLHYKHTIAVFISSAFTRWRHQCSDSSHLIAAYSFIDHPGGRKAELA